MALPTALHSIRSLLSTATNTTPHERFLQHSRRNMFGSSLPSWLADGHSKVLLKRHVRSSKYEPLVDEVELLEANHQYAHIRYPDGRESTVSTQHLAPTGGAEGSSSAPNHMVQPVDEELSDHHIGPNTAGRNAEPDNLIAAPDDQSQPVLQNATETLCDATPTLRRSERQRHPPKRFGFE